MSRFLTALTLVLPLAACSQPAEPSEKTRPMYLVDVSFPASVTSTEEVATALRVVGNCMAKDQHLGVPGRTARQLRPSATQKVFRRAGLACPAASIRKTPTYTDPGAPARTTPLRSLSTANPGARSASNGRHAS
ncbi:hypothetical protein SAMN00790413_01142 [Deinococcus hopiensis KR-140]|uniref:Lipoprotein n=1 Tax=Deinococcus hopiensis KR-140 TaxID=695939 RepID=A0A1W1VE46_9DEIO|nr:hypothetical protein SAMN00790413_01142 [Deinococcus hopiensis KR-140]